MDRLSRFLLIVLMTWPATHTLAYPTPVDFDGKLQRWNITTAAPDITWEVKTDTGNDVTYFQSIVLNAAAVWNAAPNSYFTYIEPAVGETAKVTINYNTSISGGEHAAGYALFDQSGTDGPKHCSITIAATTDMDYDSLSKTTLHEMGHCVGLGHSLVPESIMSYSLESNTFALSLDDEAGIARLYPKNGDRPRTPPGCALGSQVSPPGNNANIPGFLLLLVPVAVILCLAKLGICLQRRAKLNMFAPNPRGKLRDVTTDYSTRSHSPTFRHRGPRTDSKG